MQDYLLATSSFSNDLYVLKSCYLMRLFNTEHTLKTPPFFVCIRRLINSSISWLNWSFSVCAWGTRAPKVSSFDHYKWESPSCWVKFSYTIPLASNHLLRSLTPKSDSARLRALKGWPADWGEHRLVSCSLKSFVINTLPRRTAVARAAT